MIYRYERKFVFTNKITDEVETMIKLMMGNFSEIYSPRFINNIYFDKLGYTSYYDNVNGNRSRFKTRIRWYGNFFGNKKKLIFELKRKKGLVVIKDSKFLGYAELNPNTNLKNILNRSLDNCKRNYFLQYNKMIPVLLNRYHRKYFLSKNKKFRITVDSHQKIAAPCCPIALKNLSINAFMTIVELKYDCKWDPQASQIINGLSGRISKNSKYIDGVEFLSKNYKI